MPAYVFGEVLKPLGKGAHGWRVVAARVEGCAKTLALALGLQGEAEAPRHPGGLRGAEGG